MFLETEKRPQGEVSPFRENTHEGLAEWQRTLLKAADYMESVGKCGPENFCGVDKQRRVCALQAINFAALNYPENVGPARRRLVQCFGGDEQKVMEWSDNSPQDEVLRVMRAVALGG